MRIPWKSAALVAAILVSPCASIARAGFIIDQSNTLPVQYFYNANPNSGNTPIGQEFTPTLGSLDFVNLFVADVGSDTGPGASFQVKIHSGTITGTVLGTSDVTFVPDNTNLGGGSTVTHFTFSTPVTLTPGSLDVIELVQLGPYVGGNANFGIEGNTSDVYSRGRAIIGGTPNQNFDFYFAEGITTPEPASIGMMGLGLAFAGAWARRRSRRG